MRMSRLLLLCLLIVLGLLVGERMTPPAQAYIGGPPDSLGMMCNWSTHAMIVKVEKIDREKGIVIFRKVRDLKGNWPAEVVRHSLPTTLPERPYVLQWAEPDKIAFMFALESYKWSHTYVDGQWYAANTADWQTWNVTHGEPALLRWYSGRPARLAGAVQSIYAGKEVIVPCMVDANLEDLKNRRAKVRRLRASLKLLDFNPKRDFVGWGDDDWRMLMGMPGFGHSATLPRVDPEAQAISLVDFDGDGKLDVCLVGASRIALVQNVGDALTEFPLPGNFGARSAVWADYNGDGKPDLLLATPKGLKLLANLGTSFRDDSNLLPNEPFPNPTAAAWIDYDGDGKPDILVANGYHGLRLYRNTGDPKRPFVDVSAKVGLGPEGLASGIKGDTLTICDVNGDGRPDFLFGADSGMLFLNTKNDKGDIVFTHAKDCGISYKPGKVGPVFADFNNDGKPHLIIPFKGGIKLFRNDGKGSFTDMTAKSGDLAKFTGWATSAAWGDFDNDGHLDLVVGCLKGPNRFFRNKGDGTFEDATDKIGLDQQIFNTQAVALVDLNNDGILDMIFNNEGQESVVLLGSTNQAGKRTPLTLHVAGKDGVVGSRVQVADKAGKVAASQQISGGDGRGGQHAPIARFTLTPGMYTVTVYYSSGISRRREVTVGSEPVRIKIDEESPKTE